MTNRTFAIYVITKHGLEIAKEIQSKIPCDLYVSKRFIDIAPEGSTLLLTPMAPTLKETWHKYDCHIHIISVGAVVRMINPLMENKKVDPAVLCIDDAKKFTICLLSGHVGRGNEFTTRVSESLDNIPVITTASDVSKTLTVDILGRELGWVLDDMDRNVTRGCAAVVNQTRVAFVQETGEENFWPLEKKLPEGVEYYHSLDEINPKSFEILLICSDRNIVKTHPNHFENSLIYRPKSLVLGIGCDKDASFDVVESGVLHFLEKENLDIKSIRSIATIDLKKNESAIVELAKKYSWKIESYPAETLDQVEGIENPSDIVKKYVGTRSVAEAACLYATGGKKLLMPKKKFTLPSEKEKNMTLSIARVQFNKRENEKGKSYGNT